MTTREQAFRVVYLLRVVAEQQLPEKENMQGGDNSDLKKNLLNALAGI